MNPELDPQNTLKYLFPAPRSTASNSNVFLGVTVGGNLSNGSGTGAAANYIGTVGVVLNVGAKTVGDSDAVITLVVKASATNNFSNATNAGVTPAAGFTVSNNATGAQVFNVDTRAAAGQYLFYGVTITGTNSPAFPVAAVALGTPKTI